MVSGISSFELYHSLFMYCYWQLLMDSCKWYQFIKKKTYKEQRDWYYPLMRGTMETIKEIRGLNK